MLLSGKTSKRFSLSVLLGGTWSSNLLSLQLHGNLLPVPCSSPQVTPSNPWKNEGLVSPAEAYWDHWRVTALDLGGGFIGRQWTKLI